MTDYETYSKCKECNGDKTLYNASEDEWKCSNRSCENSPRNNTLTYMV